MLMNVRLNRLAVQQRMAEIKLTNKVLAEKMGLSQQAVSTALARGTFSHLNAAKLAEVLDTDYKNVLAKEGAGDDVQ